MNDTHMTVTGNACDDPKLRMTKTGHAVANFRVASTPRRYDSATGTWVNSPTLFVNVTCWRALAENVARSIKKGQPVIVTGRYYCRPYEVNEMPRIGYELEANGVGHDLSRGSAAFVKTERPGTAADVDADADGIPVDDSEHWLDLDAEVDPDSAGAADPRESGALAGVG